MRRVSAILSIVLSTAVWVAGEPIASLRATNYVNDFAGVLDASTQSRLNALCLQVDQKAQAQIAVVTVKSLDGQDVVSYAVALYQKFGIGAKGKDRGVLILLATGDHKYWTTVGYGLESILPDGKVGGFGREAVPLLKSGDYAGAVTLMTTRVAAVIAQDAGVTLDGQYSLPEARQRPRRNGGVGVLVTILVILFIVIPLLRALFGGGGSRGGGGGGGLGFLLGMLLGMNTGGRYRGGGGFGGFGGGGGGGGFGGGGFGGFGGGSTGGGGAGGSW